MAIRKSSFSGIPFGNDANRPANPQIGQPYFNGESSRLELYTQTTGWQNIVQETPAVVSIVGQLNQTASSTVTINGTNFAAGAIAYAVGVDSTETAATTTTLVSVVEITAAFPALSPANAPYDVKVVNPSNLYGVLYDALSVNDAPIWSTAAGSLGTFTELQSISVTVAATDTSDSTNSPLSYSVVSGALPGGLSLNSSTGVISGTASNVVPNTTYSFTIAATDGRNTAVTRAFSITINDRDPVWSTGTTLPTFTRNVAYSTTISATEDDSGAITYSLLSGSLPTGLNLSSGGTISGTPTSLANTTFTVRATVTASGNVSDRTFTLNNIGTNAPVWSTAAGALSAGEVSVAYSTTVTATDDSGSTPTYSISSGTLPTGLSLNSSTGVISGTPTVASNGTASSFTVRATDANGSTTDRAFTIYIVGTLTVTFTSSGSWTTGSTISPNSEVYLVAGGGSGGNYGSNVGCGGGGAGGVIVATQTFSPNTTYSFTIGAGASGPNGSVSNGSQGGNSVFNGLTAIGGGYGGTNTSAGGNGGSGGGGSRGAGGSGTSGQGNSGGNASSGDQYQGSGGGGKNGAGGSVATVSNGGAGGAAYQLPDGNWVGGGGGGGRSGGTGGSGGTNAGNGGNANQNGGNAPAGFGGGGGGSANTIGGNGGSGRLFIRYKG